MPRRPPLDGVMLGKIPAAPALPRALPPVDWEPAPPGPTTLEEVVRDMLVTFKREVGGRGARDLLYRVEDRALDYKSSRVAGRKTLAADGRWKYEVRLMAFELMAESIPGGAYVRHVVAGVRALRGRDPWPSEVFSRRTFKVWLPLYRTSGRTVLEQEGYLCSPERLRLHAGRAS